MSHLLSAGSQQLIGLLDQLACEVEHPLLDHARRCNAAAIPGGCDLAAMANDKQTREPEAAQPVQLALEAFAVVATATTHQVRNALALDGKQFFAVTVIPFSI